MNMNEKLFFKSVSAKTIKSVTRNVKFEIVRAKKNVTEWKSGENRNFKKGI